MKNLIDRDGELYLIKGFIPQNEADNYYQYFKENVPWRQDKISLFGKTHPLPRLQAWYGDLAYTYSGMTLEPLSWTPELLNLKQLIEEVCQHQFNSVLLNYYRHGMDQNGWHSDDEPELGATPTIASLSFGVTRKFKIRHKEDKSLGKDFMLENGDLVIMAGNFQKSWQHTLARSRPIQEGRINLTFRKILE